MPLVAVIVVGADIAASETAVIAEGAETPAIASALHATGDNMAASETEE